MILITVITIVVPVRRTNFSWAKWISGWSPNSVAVLTCLLPVLSRIGVREGVNGARLRAVVFWVSFSKPYDLSKLCIFT